MPVIDLNSATRNAYGVCVVGSGPAGLALAFKLARAGTRVLIIEAGGADPTQSPQAEITQTERHPPLAETHCRALGGTSWLWGGRVIPFTRGDFAHYDWPVSYDEVAGYLDAAAEFLGAAPLPEGYLRHDANTAFDLDATETLAPDAPLSQRYSDALKDTANLDILMQTTVVGMTYSKGNEGRTICTGLRVRSEGSGAAMDLATQNTVLATGGVETTRLLLAERARHPEAYGHLRTLGHSYTGHLTGSIAHVRFPKSTDTKTFGWQPMTGGGFRRRVFRSTDSGIASGQNVFFWARNWPVEQAEHGSAILSAKHLIKHRLMRKDVPAADKSGSVLAHLGNIVADAPTAIAALPDQLRAWRNAERAKLDHLVPNHKNAFKLHFHAEQEARHENRISLVGDVTPDHLPDIRIDFDFSNADTAAIVQAHETLEAQLTTSGTAVMVFDVPEALRQDRVMAMASDGRHQIGTAKMGRDPSESIVDPTGALHGMDGLYVSGSSVFPTAGGVPPTQTIVAFALRLADHLSQSRPKSAAPLQEVGSGGPR